MSLAVLNGGIDQMPERFQEGGRFSMRALRMMEAMRAAGFGDRIGELYTDLGTRLHVDREAPSLDLLRRSADAAGVGEFLPLAEDAWWDEAVVSSTWEAVELAGPDIGSPVIRLQGQDRGLHGPIVSPMPSGEEALRLWDALLTLTHVPGFFEVKHGRSGAPEIPRAVPAETRGSSRTDS
jgi:hypothetical protein